MEQTTKSLLSQVAVLAITAGISVSITLLVAQSSLQATQDAQAMDVDRRLNKLEAITVGLPLIYTVIPITSALDKRVEKLEERGISQGERIARVESKQEVTQFRKRLEEAR